MKETILTSFLKLLNVKHTKAFTHQYFNEHPNKYNLYGISSMLSDYNIENKGLKVSNKDDILLIEPPFIAHIGFDFVVINKINDNEVQYIQSKNKVRISLDEFKKTWTGNILIAEPNEISQEPDYKKHKFDELFLNSQKKAVLFFIILFFISGFIFNNGLFSTGKILLFITNSLGTYLGYLLVSKQLNIQGNYADKFCSLFKHSDCNNILESDASKLFGLLGWSEVGFGYFISNIIILSFLPSLITSLAIINIFGLPYTFWSIWYQKFKAKQWCTLCMTVLLFLWGIFITNLTFGYIDFSSISVLNLFVAGGIYIIFILSINIFVPIIGKSLNINSIRYEINSIKANEEVFRSLLIKQPYFEVNKFTSSLLFGDKESNNLITIFSNPHCNPCAKMHKKVNRLLEYNKNICVQYILSSFHESLNISSEYLIGVYQQRNGDIKQIFDDWFENGNYKNEEFFRKYPIEIYNSNIDYEFEKHKQWKEKSGLTATPTILINGYKLPDNFKIEDMRYFSDIEI